MARQPRFVLADQPQHIIVRGNNRQKIFCAEADYAFYLDKLFAACLAHGCRIHAYVLMTNHVHLLVSPKRENSLSKAMQTVGRYYVQYYNHRYHRTGTLWEGRYKAALIDSENYLLTCMRYIELNAVRAGMVRHPSDYRWSSYHANALGKADAVVTPRQEYEQLGTTAAECQAAYRELFGNPLGEFPLNEIREATNRGWVLGKEKFKREIQKRLTRHVEPEARGGDRRSEMFRRQRINRV